MSLKKEQARLNSQLFSLVTDTSFKGDKVRAIKDLFARGAEPTAIDSLGWGLLHYAAFLGDEKLCKTLTEIRKIDINSKAGNGETALLIACGTGKTSVAKFLISAGATVNTKDGLGLTALIAAIETEDIELVKSILDANPSLDEKSGKGETALEVARRLSNKEILALLEAKTLQNTLTSIEPKIGSIKNWKSL